MITHRATLIWYSESEPLRREIAAKAVERASRRQLGPKFDRVSIVEINEDGPELEFTFLGNNGHGAGQDVTAFLRDIVAEFNARHEASAPTLVSREAISGRRGPP